MEFLRTYTTKLKQVKKNSLTEQKINLIRLFIQELDFYWNFNIRRKN